MEMIGKLSHRRTAEANETFDIPSHWDQTSVKFSHARIRDYLKTEGDPSKRRHNCSVVPEDLNVSRVSIVTTCIKILNRDILYKYPLRSLEEHVKINWTKHLGEVNYPRFSRRTAMDLARLLSKTFHNGQGVLEMSQGVFGDFIKTWFSTSEYSSLVRKITAEHVEDLDECQREWAISVKDSTQGLFKPLVAVCASKWLTKTGWDDMAYLHKSESEVLIMYAFSTLVSLSRIE